METICVGFPSGSDGKEPACQCRQGQRQGINPWVRKIPWRRKWQLAPVFLPGEFHGQRSLEGYSPQGCKESDTNEHACHAWRPYKTWTQYTGVWGHIYFLWRFRAVIGGRKEESRTLRSTSVCEKFKSRCNLKSLNDLLEMILKDERPSICRHPVVIWGTSICSCICTENPAFFLLECLPPHSHHHDHNRIPAGEWRAEAKWCFIFQPWQVLVTTKPHQGDIWMPGWKKRYLNPQHPRHPFRNRGLGGKRVHWLKSRTDTLPWYWENQMSSEGPKEGFPGGPVVKTLHLTLQRVWAGFLVGERRSHMPHGMAKI